MNKDLLILGAGQYGMVAKEIAEAMNCFQKIDFLDDVNQLQSEDYVIMIGWLKIISTRLLQ